MVQVSNHLGGGGIGYSSDLKEGETSSVKHRKRQEFQISRVISSVLADPLKR